MEMVATCTVGQFEWWITLCVCVRACVHVNHLQALYENGLRCLAELCSSAMELLKKMGEVILLPEVQCKM